MLKICQVLAALALGMVVTIQAVAQTPPGRKPPVKVGMLTCSVSPSVGLIVGGRQNLACRFQSTAPGASESYSGDITTIGLDIGVSGGGSLAWAVFMPTGGTQRAALAGDYVGASAEVTFGYGVGGNVLIGGSNRAVTLQPFSVEGDVGVNLAVGVSGMVLR